MRRSLVPSLSAFVILAGILAACGQTALQNDLATSTVGANAPSSTIGTAPIPSNSTPAPNSTPACTASDCGTPASDQPLTAAYVNLDRNVYALTASSSDFKQITATGDAETAYPSPDGKWIAFTRTTDYQNYAIDVVRVDGADHRTLFSQDQFLALPRLEGTLTSAPNQLQWIPGTHLLAMTTRVVLQGPGSLISRDLLVINADDGTIQTLLKESDGFLFSFSPDGKWIVTSMADSVNLYDASGHPAAPAKFYGFPLVNTASESPYLPEIQWSSDSASFGFFVPPINPFYDPEEKTRVVIVSAQDATIFTPMQTSMAFLFPQQISDDFSKVAYTVIPDPNTGATDLHIASMDGTKDEIYFAGKKTNMFFWSPDSLHFLIASNDGTNNVAYQGQIGNSPQPITAITSIRDAKWTDASHYLIVDKAASGWQVWYGEIGAQPVIVYSDSVSDDGSTYLVVNR